ncbi:hypothetical protein EB796_022210 [Bugula neritina]|uniref:Uncharacterized protein n=1 Tax=Bugula neritina TaxID=10212 RepID=A0A7J7J1Y6_BUGNE|nr:hypothetical protein EB796_022210 [Bugula neritina]
MTRFLSSGKESDRVIFLKAANTMKRSCRNLASDSSPDITPLLGAVNHLFPIYFRPSSQKSSAPSCQHKRELCGLPRLLPLLVQKCAQTSRHV